MHREHISDDQIRTDVRAGRSQKEMAKAYGMGRITLHLKEVALGIERTTGRRTSRKGKQAKELLLLGTPTAEVKRRTGLSYKGVGNIARKLEGEGYRVNWSSPQAGKKRRR